MEGTKNKICYFAKLKKHEFHEMKLIKEFASRIANNHLENKFMHATTKAYIDSIDEVRANMEDIKLRINSHVTTLSPNIEVITTIDEKSFFDSHSMKQLYSDLTNSKSETEQELKNCRNMIVKHFLSHRESDYGLEEIRLAWQLEDERKQLKHESYGEQTAEKTIIKKHIASLFDSLPEELVSFIIGICFLISLSVAGWDYALGVLIILVIYFAPSMVAIIRKHDSKTSVFVLNLFLGWTFVGWVISLVWAFVAKGNNIANNRR
jgi:hypothetical protein